MKYAVIGFPKCGTISTDKWLRDKGEDSVKIEWPIFWEVSKVKQLLQDRTPVIVTRNKDDFLWSFYEYFGYKGQLPFKDFLELRIRSTRFLNFTPLEMSDYDMWIDNLSSLDPIVYKLEELQSLPEFPHENLTRRKTVIPDEEKETLSSLSII